MCCQKLNIFINESFARCDWRNPDMRDDLRIKHETLAASGDCQFNRRCGERARCPLGRQVLVSPAIHSPDDFQNILIRQRRERKDNTGENVDSE